MRWVNNQLLDCTEGFLSNALRKKCPYSDLEKVNDYIPHELLIAKLECSGLDKPSVRLMLDYLTNQKQITKVAFKHYFNSWYDISIGVLKGSILGSLLFNIFINDLFFSITKSKVCNFKT